MQLPLNRRFLSLGTSNVAGPNDIHPQTVFRYLIQGIHGCTRYGYELDCSPFPTTRRGLRWHPCMELQGKSHRQTKVSEISVRVVKYWNKLPTSVLPIRPLTVPSSICTPTPCSVSVSSSGPLWPTLYHYK